ncbi:MAG: hypothetical protein NT069_23210, partial [Planctomycetota bacterium]|nr:hypothetical protein [Planctomycetota bacterium]
ANPGGQCARTVAAGNVSVEQGGRNGGPAAARLVARQSGEQKNEEPLLAREQEGPEGLRIFVEAGTWESVPEDATRQNARAEAREVRGCFPPVDDAEDLWAWRSLGVPVPKVEAILRVPIGPADPGDGQSAVTLRPEVSLQDAAFLPRDRFVR